jgi:hypothetical protein
MSAAYYMRIGQRAQALVGYWHRQGSLVCGYWSTQYTCHKMNSTIHEMNIEHRTLTPDVHAPFVTIVKQAHGTFIGYIEIETSMARSLTSIGTVGPKTPRRVFG